jgi:hypothetical protein
MADFEVFGPYVVALLMGLGAACVFVWGVLAGALIDTNQASQTFFRAEMENERFAEHRPDQ